MPERAPSHFFVGINKNDFAGFSRLIAEKAPGSELHNAPMLRGNLVSLGGRRSPRSRRRTKRPGC